MNYEEFEKYRELENSQSKLIKCYQLPCGEIFYIEPPFYTQLMGFKSIYPEQFDRVIAQMETVVIRNKKVEFVYDYENPFLPLDGFIYVEFSDITDALKIYYEDKSRGSDYGD